MHQMPRYLKIHEFVAHQGNVNCCKVGRKSAGVLVTGGEDKKVNLWTIGTQNRTLSLSGHQSPIESVAFDDREEVVAAGAINGSIKLFDLEQAKVQRSLGSHKSSVTCLDFSNLFGLVSGSMDTSVKLWDVRDKGCKVTCKGHSSYVRHVKFSPDGKWVASGADNGEVKIFDLAAGKVVHEFSQHTNAITGLEFHPQEYLMATSSADKTVKVWDLESMQLLESTPPETTGVRALAFHPDGRCLFSALADGLRVWQWEPPPALQQDNVDVPWAKVSDVVVMKDKNKLVGCSYHQAFVGLWVVDLKDVRPFGGFMADMAADAAARGGGYAQAGASYGRSNSAGNSGAATAAAAAAPNMHDFALRRGQLSGTGMGARLSPDPMVAGMQQMGLEDKHSPVAAPVAMSRSISMGQERPARPSGSSGGGGREEVSTSMGQAPVARHPAAPSQPSARSASAGIQAQSQSPEHRLPPRGAPASGGDAAHLAQARGGHMVSVGVGVGDSLFKGQVEQGALSKIAQQGAPAARAGSGGRGYEAAGPSGMSEPSRQPARVSAGAGSSAGGGPNQELDHIAAISSGSDRVVPVLMARVKALQEMHAWLRRGDAPHAFQAARRHNNPVASADFLDAALSNPKFGNSLGVDTVADMVPVLEGILGLDSEKHVQIGLNLGKLLCRGVVPLIRDTIANYNPRVVDIAGEQRKQRADSAQMVLKGLLPRLGFVARQRAGTSLAAQAQEIAEQIGSM